MKELTIPATLENIPAVTAFIDEQLEALNCSMKAQMQIDIAIDELFGNIAHYAYGDGTGEATVRFDFDETTRSAVITFMDRGVPFLKAIITNSSTKALVASFPEGRRSTSMSFFSSL